MRARQLALLLLLALPLTVCSVRGSGKPVPTLPSDFAAGATVPGWVLTPPEAGRGEVASKSSHANGRWSVILSRTLAPRPRDLRFSFAIMSDGIAHAGKSLIRLTADPAVFPFTEVVVCRPVPNGHVIPDGVLSPGEWNLLDLSAIPIEPQNDLPTGAYPPSSPMFVNAGSAYDDEYIYFIFRWTDPASTESNLGPLLEWNGSSWIRRPHRANDLNGNGVIDSGEVASFGAAAEDEDRLALFFPIHDSTGAFRSGGSGCAVSCHQNLGLDASGAQAVHAWAAAGDLTDVWTWRASSTAPARVADDRTLGFGDFALGSSGGGSGFAADPGIAPFFAQDPATPVAMFAAPPAGHEFLVDGPIPFAASTEPGFPVIPTVSNSAAPYSVSNFDGTGASPTTWTGMPPFFTTDYLPAFVQRAATGSRADVETGSSFSGNQWTVEFRRRRVTRDASGAPRADDVMFDEDAPFEKQGFDVTSAALGLPFSISITDRASGHGVRETLYPGPLRLSRDPALAGILASDVALHDYGAGFNPAVAADFTDSRESRPPPSAGTDVNLVLKAGTDGGQKLFVLAEWNDPTADAARDEWTWNGFTWTRAGAEDELRIAWNSTIERGAFVSGGGCAYLCHGPGGPFGAPAAPHFSTHAINETADVWRWSAGRAAIIQIADDQTADWRFFDLAEGGAANAAVHGDAGKPPFTPNFDLTRPFPLYMSQNDPNANAISLTIGITGSPDPAVAFVDVLGNLPPPPPGGPSGVSFAADVQPIFATICSLCHPPLANLNLQTYAGVIAGGQSGPVVVPGNPAASVLIQRLTGQIQPQMPLGGPYLSAADIQLISSWIAEGAANN